VYPPDELTLPACAAHLGHGPLHQVRGSVDILAGERMRDGLRSVAVQMEPPARPPVQLGDPVGMLLAQSRAQDVGEQVVIAEPLPPVIQRYEEQIGPFQLDQPCGTVGLAGHCIA
jgi:hypothetical protein